METSTNGSQHNKDPVSTSSHRRASSGPGLLARFSFLKATTDTRSLNEADDEGGDSVPASSAIATLQQHKTRRRRGSLRKVALLGRGAQRDRRDGRSLTIDIPHGTDLSVESSGPQAATAVDQHDALGLKKANLARHSGDGPPNQSTVTTSPIATSSTAKMPTMSQIGRDGDRANLYTSTTDEEDVLQIASSSMVSRNGLSLSSGSESYFGGRVVTKRRRSFQQAKSPLSYSGMSTNALPTADSDWDYAETEWWGWVVLTVTWFVFVVGMGSCLDVWFWAWDVGKTPYAPPELEDDPTLPIVGYYPALIILTGVMAWVWVVVAWVGMKYFRHAKISGD